MDTAEDWLNLQLELPSKNGAGTAEVWTNNGPDPDTDSVNWWLERDAAWWTTNGDAASGVDTTMFHSIDTLGDRWSVLLLTTLFFGLHRYDDIAAAMGIATNILADRLRQLERAP